MDRDSSRTFTTRISVGTKTQMEKALDEADTESGFRKFYVEASSDDVLTDEELRVVNQLDVDFD